MVTPTRTYLKLEHALAANHHKVLPWIGLRSQGYSLVGALNHNKNTNVVVFAGFGIETCSNASFSSNVFFVFLVRVCKNAGFY